MTSSPLIPLCALAFLASACATTETAAEAPQVAAEPVDPWVLHIEIGRWGAMLGQTEEHSETLAARQPVRDESSEDTAVFAARLRQTAFELNAQRIAYCRAGLVTEASCVAPFAPAWLTSLDATPPSLDVAQARSNELGEAVMTFWDAVCEAAQGPHDPNVIIPVEERACPME
ncbi:MAG: hypothetical protein AB7O04_05015 [Hyphomonadaceae bacterium]